MKKLFLLVITIMLVACHKNNNLSDSDMDSSDVLYDSLTDEDSKNCHLSIKIQQHPDKRYVMLIAAETDCDGRPYFTLNGNKIDPGKRKVEEQFKEEEHWQTYYFEEITIEDNVMTYSHFPSGKYCVNIDNVSDCRMLLRIFNDKKDPFDNYELFDLSMSYHSPGIDTTSASDSLVYRCEDKMQLSGVLKGNRRYPNDNYIITRFEDFTLKKLDGSEYLFDISYLTRSAFFTIDEIEYDLSEKSSHSLTLAQCENDKNCPYCRDYNCSEEAEQCRNSLENCAYLKYNIKCYPYYELLKYWQFGTENDDDAQDIIHTNDGEIYIVGRSLGNITGEVNQEKMEIFLQKRSPDGEVIWTNSYGNDSIDYVDEMIMDDEGNLYIYGLTIVAKTNTDIYDVFLMKINGDGQLVWSIIYEAPTNDIATDITLDENGVMYVGINLDDKNSFKILKVNKEDGSVTGEILWTSGSHERLSDIQADDEGNLYITGMVFNEDPEIRSVPFFVRIAPDGTEKDYDIVLDSIEGDIRSSGRAIAILDDGRILLTGYTDKAPEDTYDNEVTTQDVFFFKYDVEGKLQNDFYRGSGWDETPFNIATDGDEYNFIFGYSYLPYSEYSQAFLGNLHHTTMFAYSVWGEEFQMRTYDGVIHHNKEFDLIELYIVGRANGALEGNENLGDFDAFIHRRVIYYDR